MESQNTFETTTSRVLKSAGVPTRYLAAEPRPDLLGGAYLYGKTGRGKTYAACGALKSFVQSHIIEVEGMVMYHGPSCKFVNVPDWFAQMRATYDRRGESEQDVFERYAESALLVIDDLGKGSKSEWAVERLYLLLDYRCNEMLPTIITSNYGLARVASMLSTDDETIQAIASRALDVCDGRGILMEGTDRRRHPENSQNSRNKQPTAVL